MRRWIHSVLLTMPMCIGLCLCAFTQQDQPAPGNPPQSDQNAPPGPSVDQTQTPDPPPKTEAQPQPEAPQSVTPAQPEIHQPSATPPKPKPAVKKRKPAKKHATATQSGKVVVRNGGAKDNSGQLTPALSPDQELRSRANTVQLLATTDSNLKKISDRQLSAAQQSTLDQIRTYVRQSRAASDAGDLPRAHTLANKAHLLSDELAGK